jgi:uncharacterized membrane protein
MYAHSILLLVWSLIFYAAKPLQARPHLKLFGLIVFGIAGASVVFGNISGYLPLLRTIAVGDLPVVNLLGAGYLVPALLSLALMWFAEKRNDKPFAFVTASLACGAGLLWLVLEYRHAFQGNTLVVTQGWQAAEAYGYASLFLLCHVIIRRLPWAQARIPFRTTGLIAFVAGLAWTVLGNILVLSPLLQKWSVGALPGANLLALAYLAPAALLAVMALRPSATSHPAERNLAWVLIGALLFIWCNLTLRHAFQGPVLTLTRDYTSNEYYGYSVLWLALSGVLFLLAMRLRHKGLEYAFMGLTLLTIVKVFAFDMSVLSGVLRALSFMGLGAALVGLGLLYRRFIYRRSLAETVPENS